MLIERPELPIEFTDVDAVRELQPMALEILHRNPDYVVIHKPRGIHVHQPEDSRHRVPRDQTVLFCLRKQIEQFLYPVHRLDVATEGVMVMALKKEVAARLQGEFQNGRVQKVYHAICRGWTDESGEIDIPLERDSNQTLADAKTSFRTLARTECPFPIGKRYQTARFSLVEVRPHTGRWHQIRRHMARTTHPIVGDREHGDTSHNRYFREVLGESGLWLRATRLTFEGCEYSSPFTERWTKMSERLGFAIDLQKVFQELTSREGAQA